MDTIVFSIKETCRQTSLSRATVYEKIKQGELETVKVGGRRLVKVASVRRLVGEAA
jgi:excisionase family DNA binding protein